MAEQTTWKGKPLLDMNPDAWPRFSFGVSKAEMVLDQILEVVEFVREHGDPTVVDHFEEEMAKYAAKNMIGQILKYL